MTWIKLDDNAVDHPKVEILSDRAFRWWVKGLSYASRFLTDGLLPPVFWKKVPANDRKELTGNNLWDWVDPNFMIHDYHHHQARKEDVEAEKQRNRENSRAYRERRRAERRQQPVSADVSADASAERQQPVSDESAPQITENREHIQITENRDERRQADRRGGGLILSSREYLRLQETHAFIGSVLRVPNVLHAELRAKSGVNGDQKLQDWYLQLNEELELSGKGTGDVFQWLRPRHQAYAVAQGWIDPAPKPQAPAPKPFSVADALAREAARKAGPR